MISIYRDRSEWAQFTKECSEDSTEQQRKLHFEDYLIKASSIAPPTQKKSHLIVSTAYTENMQISTTCKGDYSIYFATDIRVRPLGSSLKRDARDSDGD